MVIKREQPIEDILWQSAKKLRGNIEPSEYKHIVLGLIFLKYISDKFEKRKNQLIKEGKEEYVNIVEFYSMKNVFFLEKDSTWQFIQENSKKPDLAIKIDTALHKIETNNQSLKGALPDNYFSRIGIETSRLASLVDTVNNKFLSNIDNDTDIVGRVYEYFLAKFALQEGKGKGEFYTPKSIVGLINELIKPHRGKIYDPCCGSGGMFVQSMKFIEAHRGDKKDISIYGQEGTQTTYKLAKMNLAIRGIGANLGDLHANTFFNDQHINLKADYIMANPPFNQDDWREKDELINDQRWQGYDIPPSSNANYAWILHMVSKLSERGIAGFILGPGATSAGSEEYKIRKKLIENDLVEAIITLPRNIFYTTDLNVNLWILNKNKKGYLSEFKELTKDLRNREGEILFMDLRRWGSPLEKKFIQLTSIEIKEASNIFHNWQSETNFEKYNNVPEFCYSAKLEEIKENDFSLVPSKYIPLKKENSALDFENEMNSIKIMMRDILKEEIKSQKDVLKAFDDLGYEIKL